MPLKLMSRLNLIRRDDIPVQLPTYLPHPLDPEILEMLLARVL
jgi:hypothetical protein